MKFEKSMQQIRPELDVEKTDEEYLWKGISEGINRRKTRKKLLFWRMAASLLLLVVLGFLFQHIVWERNQDNKLLLKGYGEKIANQEAQLVKEINTYQEKLKQADFNKNKLATEFSELKRIDRLINQYSEDLEAYGPKPKILHTLIDLYHKKIRVMDRMLNEIQKTKRHENHKFNI